MSETAFRLIRVADVPATDRWLRPRERVAMRRYTSARRRADWRAGRWAARLALGQTVPRSSPVEVLTAQDGAPEARLGERRLPLTVSISHRGGYAAALAAPARAAAGCDLELIEPREAGFAADWFTPAERAVVEAAPAGERDALVTLIWSAKEAVLKALRQGLRIDTREVEISVGEGTFTAVYEARRVSGWWRREGDLMITVALEMKR